MIMTTLMVVALKFLVSRFLCILKVYVGYTYQYSLLEIKNNKDINFLVTYLIVNVTIHIYENHIFQSQIM
jgi:hypothetical protein